MYQTKRIAVQTIRAMRAFAAPKNKFCPVCKTKVRRFLPIDESYLAELDKHQYMFSIFAAETFNLLQYSCPHCGASDRYRLYALFIENMLKGSEKRLKFIDFAPDDVFRSYLKKFRKITYRSADLYMENVDDKVDLTNMTVYEDNSVDAFLCSHMLEHISDDRKAAHELYRILKTDGWGILMVPIMLTLKDTFEDPAAVTEADRWRCFGQFDHVRLYSKQGFLTLLSKAGFHVSQFGTTDFGKDTFLKCGINDHSVLYVVSKQPLPKGLSLNGAL